MKIDGAEDDAQMHDRQGVDQNPNELDLEAKDKEIDEVEKDAQMHDGQDADQNLDEIHLNYPEASSDEDREG